MAAAKIEAWSFSRLQDWRGCARKAKYKHIDKIREPGNDAMARGSAIDQMEGDFITGKLKKCPPEIKSFEAEFLELRKRKAVVQEQWAFDKDWVEVDWFAKNAWCRIKTDVHTHDLKTNTMMVVDCKTGKLAWKKPSADDPNGKDNTDTHQCYSLVGMTLGKEKLLVTAPNIYRARDGKLLSFFKLTNFGSCIGTPVIGEGKIFRVWTTGGPGKTTLQTIVLPALPDEPFKAELLKGVVIDANRFHRWYCGWYSASPLYHEGLVYCMSEDAVITVVDAQKQEIVYQQQLDLDLEMVLGGMARGGACASPALAAKYIYLFGNHGACAVIEPGRTFRQVARNRIESGSLYPDVTISCPVFEGKRLYYRTAESLYCIEER